MPSEERSLELKCTLRKTDIVSFGEAELACGSVWITMGGEDCDHSILLDDKGVRLLSNFLMDIERDRRR